MIKVEREAERVMKIASHYTRIMEELGIPETPDNKETPMRVAKALLEMTETTRKGNEKELIAKCTSFDNQAPGVVLEQEGIEFSSMCSHHHLPFIGKVRIKYIAGEKIIGLSKFNRIVEFFSKKPQVQEDMTMEIAMFLVKQLKPKYLKVEIYDCLHTCMCCRGVKSRATTNTHFEYHGEE